MKYLLSITALLEAATGLALIAMPALVAKLLLGGEITGVAIPVGRMAGFGLLSLGIACWPGRDAARTRHVAALRAMLFYNTLTALLMIWLGIGGEFSGPLLWPAAVLHAVFAAWCVIVLTPSHRRAAPTDALP